MRDNESRTLWELAVLAFLRERRMHPYEMQRLLRVRHKDELLSLKRGSLYHAIKRLARAGLIEPASTGREGRRPERTTYRLTPRGRAELVRSVRGRLALPRRERSEFFGGLSFLVYLTPKDAAAQLGERLRRLEAEVAELLATRKRILARVARVNLLEEEYLLALRRAELRWVRRVREALRRRRLKWKLKDILTAARAASRRR